MPRTVLITDVTRFIGMPGSKALLEEGYKVFGTDPDFTDDGKRSAYEKACPGATASCGVENSTRQLDPVPWRRAGTGRER